LKFGFGGVGDFVYKAGSKVSDIVAQIKEAMAGPAAWAGGKISGGISGFLKTVKKLFGIGGGTYPGHGAHGSQNAWDFMISNKAQGNAIAAMGRAVASLVIWNNQIWSRARSGEGWRPYTRYGSNATPSQKHTDHVHVEWYKHGGWINEPVMGVGQRTGRTYGFGESGPEYVTPKDKMINGGGGGTHFHFHAPVYGDHTALKRALVDMQRRGQLSVIDR
jgi:hypothetical protein